MNNFNSNGLLINEIYSKCFKQQQDIADGVNEIMKGLHKIGALDKVKNKILEKLENYEESLKMMEKIVNELPQVDSDIWKKNLSKDLDEAVNLQKKKQKGSDLFLKGTNFLGTTNLSLLEEEHTSLKTSIRMGSDIEKQAMRLNEELTDQKSYLERIGEKVNKIYHKLQISNSITHFLVRRGRGDTYLCLFMGFLTILILYYVYYYVRPKVRGI